ncbi:MAG: molybdate ABC transporter substrate-binding protein [Beijerinckiaceae bacterium]|nr:molybdate ABC transporter substrate-binding protein [Beijerinckiaceae bacterium]
MAAYALLAGLCALAPNAAQAQGAGPVVFAAASLKNALDEVSAGFAKDAGKPAPRLSYAGSPALARQIEQGAPADVFISADTDWMDYLEGKRLIRNGARVDLLGNSIVLVAPAAARVDLAELTVASLARALGGGRLALADVKTVPAGRYAKASLEKLGLWDAVKDKLAQSENVRAALVFVARGEAPLGIVYSTDAAAEPRVRVVAALPRDSHPPIIYPAAVTSASTHPDAGSFLAYLAGPQASAAFVRHGFVPLHQPAR